MPQRVVVGKPGDLQPAVAVQGPFQPRQPNLGPRPGLGVPALMPPHHMIRPVPPALLPPVAERPVARAERLQMTVGVTPQQRIGQITVLSRFGTVKGVPGTPQALPLAPPGVRSLLPDVPQRPVRPHCEQLLAAVLIPRHGQAVRGPDPGRRAAQLPPRAPAAVGRGLPDLPHLAVTTETECLLPAVLVLSHREPRRQRGRLRRVQRGPPTPAVARRGLPAVPQRAVAGDREDLLAAVGVPPDDVAGDAAAGRGSAVLRPPLMPGPVRRDLPDAEHPARGAHEHLQPAILVALHNRPGHGATRRPTQRRPITPRNCHAEPSPSKPARPALGARPHAAWSVKTNSRQESPAQSPNQTPTQSARPSCLIRHLAGTSRTSPDAGHAETSAHTSRDHAVFAARPGSSRAIQVRCRRGLEGATSGAERIQAPPLDKK